MKRVKVLSGVRKEETHPLHGQVGELIEGDPLDEITGFSKVRFGLNSFQWIENRFIWPIEIKKKEDKKNE